MSDHDAASSTTARSAIGRRAFLGRTGSMAVAGMLAPVVWAGDATDGKMVITASDGYLIVDSKKCQGCVSCMLACSLVHEGKASLSAARIQVLQDSFKPWPEDISIEPCRQCVTPACVDACPHGALTHDPDAGNVRRVDQEKCTGCGLCFSHCPYRPQRLTFVADGDNWTGLHAAKCDLCAGARFHWDEIGGGPDGKQVCVEVCPVGAIAFTRETPKQTVSGYEANLREEAWGELGYPTD